MHMLGAKVQGNYNSNEIIKIVESQDNDFVDIAKSSLCIYSFR